MIGNHNTMLCELLDAATSHTRRRLLEIFGCELVLGRAEPFSLADISHITSDDSGAPSTRVFFFSRDNFLLRYDS